jgi:hypothetical protein
VINLPARPGRPLESLCSAGQARTDPFADVTNRIWSATGSKPGRFGLYDYRWPLKLTSITAGAPTRSPTGFGFPAPICSAATIRTDTLPYPGLRRRLGLPGQCLIGAFYFNEKVNQQH